MVERTGLEEAWAVESTEKVTQIARRILEALELPEDVEIPDWLVDLLEKLDLPAEGSGHPAPGIPLPGLGGNGGCLPPSIPDLPELPDVDIVPAPYGDLVQR